MVDLDQIRQNLIAMGMPEEDVPEPMSFSQMPAYFRLAFPGAQAKALADIDKAVLAMEVGTEWWISVNMGGSTLGGSEMLVMSKAPTEIRGTGCADQAQEDGGERREIVLRKVGSEWLAEGFTEYEEPHYPLQVVMVEKPLEID